MFTLLHNSHVGSLGTSTTKHHSIIITICQSLVQMRGGTRNNIHFICICNLYWLAQACEEEVKFWLTVSWNAVQFSFDMQLVQMRSNF